MPLFEFHCETCKKSFEKLLKKQKADVSCPVCGQTAQKAVSVFASGSASCGASSGSGFG